MRSNPQSGSYSERGVCNAVRMPLQGDSRKFSSASPAASLSMSIPVITAPSPIGVPLSLWARTNATVPVPVPMSSICLSEGCIGAQMPSRTPSVLTFIADRSFFTSNFLKWKMLIPQR